MNRPYQIFRNDDFWIVQDLRKPDGKKFVSEHSSTSAAQNKADRLNEAIAANDEMPSVFTDVIAAESWCKQHKVSFGISKHSTIYRYLLKEQMNNPKIVETKSLFQSRWLNVFEKQAEIKGNLRSWTFCSRQRMPETAATKKPDAVVIVAYKDDSLVVTSEYRIPIEARELGFPAGLIEEGQTPEDAAIREMREETGLNLEVRYVSPNLFSSAGLTNESTVYVFGKATGEVSSEYLEPGEDIQVKLLSQEELSKLVNDQTIAFSARAWPMMLFLANGLKLSEIQHGNATSA